MTYHQLLAELTAIGAGDPAGEAVALSGMSREWCLLNRHAPLPDSAEEGLRRRKCGEPLQYITGEAWFYGHRFHVTPDCLIPQPDTEHAVYHALPHLPDDGILCDLCTGSGCIAISALLEKPGTSAVAMDISPPALAVARENAVTHHVSNRLRFLEADVMDADVMLPLIETADVIVSNPPYINTDIICGLSIEVLFEPLLALDGGADGMEFYRRFILDYAPRMKKDAVMILEIGYDQSERIAELCTEANLSCTLHRDFGGNIRVAEISRTILPKTE